MDADEREHFEARLRVLDLLVEALDNRQEVLELIGTAATPVEAEERIRARFAVNEPYISRAVLDLPLSRLTESERVKIAGEADEVRAQLSQ